MTESGTATLTFTVAEDDTASALGSGDLPVLGTPRLLAWAEAATCAAIADEVDGNRTSVGTRVALQHRAASPVGEKIVVTADVVHRDGRLVRFRVVALDSEQSVVGDGELTRVIVDRSRFLSHPNE